MPGIEETIIGRFEEINAARLFENLNAFTSGVCFKLIQKVGKGEIQGMIKKAPVLGLNGGMKLEGDYGNGGGMNPEGAYDDGGGDNI